MGLRSIIGMLGIRRWSQASGQLTGQKQPGPATARLQAFSAARPMASVSQPTTVHLEIPPTIEVPGYPFRIMPDEVTVGLFKQLVDGGYRVVCDNAAALLVKLQGAPGEALTGVSLVDGMALTKALNKQLALSGQTGWEWAVPTEDEWLTATQAAGKQLSGRNKEWTDTTFEHGKGRHPLRSLALNYRVEAQPGNRLDDSALRLILRKKA